MSRLLSGITSNHDGDLYCLNCFHSYRTENKLKKHEKVCNDYDYCYLEMPDEDNKILEFNHGGKSLKIPFMIYADLECLLEKIHSCKIILKNLRKKKKLTICSLVIQYLQVARLTQQITNFIVNKKMEIVLNVFVKTCIENNEL